MIFESAADSCENPYQAEALRAASAYRLRHTSSMPGFLYPS